MPSWGDGETSSEGPLEGEYPEEGYVPLSIEDPTWCGIAVDTMYVCCVHQQQPEKFVAYEGRNTGRRFLACAVKDEVTNCGFVEWVDPEWLDSLQYTLHHVWAKMDEINFARMDEQFDNHVVVKKLEGEKSKMQAEKAELENKYNALKAEVKKMLEASERNVQVENYARFKQEEETEKKLQACGQEKIEVLVQLAAQEEENSKLKTELSQLKEVLTKLAFDEQSKGANLTLQEYMDNLQLEKNNYAEKEAALKEEKKKLEYNLYDLLKVSEANKCKLKKIKQILDE